MAEQLYGIMAEFDTATELVDAARLVRDAGYVKTDAFSPFPIHEIDEALGIKRSILPYLIFAGGVTGVAGAGAAGVALELEDCCPRDGQAQQRIARRMRRIVR